MGSYHRDLVLLPCSSGRVGLFAASGMLHPGTVLLMMLVILLIISRPLRPWKIGLVLAMAGSYLVVIALPFARDFFELTLPEGIAWLVVAIAAFSGSVGVWVTSLLIDHIERTR